MSNITFERARFATEVKCFTLLLRPLLYHVTLLNLADNVQSFLTATSVTPVPDSAPAPARGTMV